MPYYTYDLAGSEVVIARRANLRISRRARGAPRRRRYYYFGVQGCGVWGIFFIKLHILKHHIPELWNYCSPADHPVLGPIGKHRALGAYRSPARSAVLQPISILRFWISEGLFDSSRILNIRGGIPRPIGDFPESLSQAILAGIILVGRLWEVSPMYNLWVESQIISYSV